MIIKNHYICKADRKEVISLLKTEAFTASAFLFKRINLNANIMKEIWKNIPGYEGFYQASNLGRIKSLERTTTHFYKNIYPRKFVCKEKILTPNENRGYYKVSLNATPLAKKTIKVHQLVAMAFLNHKPCGNTLVVNHINFNKLDNRVENLEIVTTRENSNKKHLKSSSKYTGVYWHSSAQKWVSRIVIKRKKVHLGSFDCEVKASEAYEKALYNFINFQIEPEKRICASKYKGVSFAKKQNKWISRVQENKIRITIGYFDTEEEAFIALTKYNEEQLNLKQ